MNLFSLTFIAFILTLLLLYYVLPHRFQWILLLIANILFYACAGLKGLIFLFITSFSVWFAGRRFEKLTEENEKKKATEGLSREEKKALKAELLARKRRVLYPILLLNFGILAFLKYLPDLTGIGFLLPLGISFYTFTAVGYLIDTYKGTCKPESNYGRMLLFISFFPQMIQGPIGRYEMMSEQFREEHSFDWEKTKRGLLLILFGLLKKYAIASMLSEGIAAILDHPAADTPGSIVVFGILMYSFQQYADFSGGIDLVIGIAELFGITMAPNFRQPYFSTSLGDFWRRWHISLGAWMKDYVFYPFVLTKKMQQLGKKASDKLGRQTGRVIPAVLGNILVFAIVGIWHGAKLHFLLWGLYNGIVIAGSELLTPVFTKWKTGLHIPEENRAFYVFQIIRTFVIVNIGWYFDRVERWSDILLCFRNTIVYFAAGRFVVTVKGLFASCDVFSPKCLAIAAFTCLLVLINSVIRERGKNMYDILATSPLILRWGVIYLIMILIQFAMATAGVTEQFLYAVF